MGPTGAGKPAVVPDRAPAKPVALAGRDTDRGI
jgi:hypothetical protein